MRPRADHAGRRAFAPRLLTLTAAALLSARARAQVTAETAPLSPLALVGRWTTTDAHPSLGTVTVRVSITQAMRFSGEALAGERSFWQFGGTLGLDGRRLTWRYASSSLPLNDAARTDVDEVLSVDAERLLLRSALSGKERLFSRLR